MRVRVAFVLLLAVGCSHSRDEGELARHRNLGKAYYENPTTKEESVREFRQAFEINRDSSRDKLNYALALLRWQGHEQEAIQLLRDVQKRDPSLPHTWFNLGIVYKRRGDVKQAIAQFEGMLQRAPDEAVAHFQLGSLYRGVNRSADALKQFETAARLDPQMAAARFQLYDMSRRASNADTAKTYMADFERVRELQKSWVIPEDVEWCNYAEIYDPPQTALELKAQKAGSTPIDIDGIGETDLLTWSASGIKILRPGKQLVAGTGLDGLKGVNYVAPGDFDNDGRMDLCVITDAGPELYRNVGGRFERLKVNLPSRSFNAAVWIDFDHDYDPDLMLLGAEPALMRNQGTGWADRTGDFPFVKGEATSAQVVRIDPDSKAFDLAVAYRDRAPVLYHDRLGGRYTVEAFPGKYDTTDEVAAQPQHWIRVQLKGVRSPKLAQDALIEIKAGSLYRREFYRGVPLTFDTADHTTVDVVRITWPNGLIQNEVQQAADKTHVYEEAQRLSGSCPMVWCWDGRGFEFITDVLGVAPLGARDGDGSYFPVNHEEYVRIPGSALRLKDGRFEVRITEELSEVTYLDQAQLFALDHPAGTEIFTNEKFKAPPYPEFRLFSVKKRIYPRAASDGHGDDVLPLLLAKDQRYPDRFERSETGVAELHTLELDFGAAAPAGVANLLLNGWVDWPDGSTFRRVAQESKAGLQVPYLQVQDSTGRWKTVNSDMGMPAGKPKTIVVPVAFPSASRKVRIVTNLCVYWDEIFLSEDVAEPGLRPVPLPLLAADLRFRGFSESRIDPQRKQPDAFVYGRLAPTSFWNPTPGLYTRFGAVDTLLHAVDDQFIIMGSGDELRLQFGDSPRAGAKRDFLLNVDGWAKDSDPNTAFSFNVAPLPFHEMSRYPYPAGEHYPRDGEHDRYQRTWNTRPAGKQLAALGPG